MTDKTLLSVKNLTTHFTVGNSIVKAVDGVSFALEAGIYTFNVTDIKGCQFDSIAVVEQANIVSLSLSAESPICRNDSTEITINISNPSHNIYTITIKDSIQQSTDSIYGLSQLEESLILIYCSIKQ